MPIRGIITLPGDKSISHRALLISSLIKGENSINNLSTSQDVKHTKSCLEKIGIILKQNKNSLIVKGRTFKQGLREKSNKNFELELNKFRDRI